MNNIKRIRINKNRGWRGLAELIVEDDEKNEVLKMIFSFSQDVWNDMLKGYIVAQNENNYIILNFDNVESLPRPDQQRSVLIKSFLGTVVNSWEYPKTDWKHNVEESTHWHYISHFTKNNNHHTTSDWNCVRN